MSNGAENSLRRPIEERSSSIILRIDQLEIAAAGAIAFGAFVGPAVGLKWRIDHSVVSGAFNGNPDVNDAGSVLWSILNGASPFTLTGRGIIPDSEEAQQFGQGSGPMTLEFGDTIRLIVNAADSPGIGITGAGDFWGWEYDAI